ncbi:MAG: FtsX-like permease family protein [Bacteroidales bacterium]|nr:FtsX-like permease family protein [Bacteroidales bacterium]
MIRLAWKNIWRNPTRSLIILVAIAIGVISGSVFTAFYNGMIYQRIDDAIANETSNIQIHAPSYLENKEITDTIANIHKILPLLDTITTLKSYSLRFKTMSMLSSANNNSGIVLIGIDPIQEKKTTNIWKHIVQGQYLSSEKKNTLLIGEKLANKLKIKLRSKVVLTLQDTKGNLISAAFRVSGIYNTGNTGFDERVVYATWHDIKNLFPDSTLLIHEIAIALQNDKHTSNYAEKLKISLPFADVKTWKELYPEVGLMADYTQYLQLIYMTIIFLALSFGIINTMLMAVMERTRELGMLMAIGMKRTKIFQMITYETIMLMGSGTIVGLFLTYIIIQILSTTGINLASFAKGLNQMGLSAMVYPVLTLREYLQTIELVLVAGFLSSLIPARRALKLTPSEALRKQ